MRIDLELTENVSKPFEQAMNDEMEKAVDHFESELVKIRTGRAHTSLVEDIMVDHYEGQPMPLKNIAALSAPDVKLIVIQPWDQTTIPSIERALSGAKMGATPTTEGNIIRLRLPDMSADRREDLAKILSKKQEECKVAVRNIRKEFNNFIRDAKKDKKISENFFNRLSDLLQNITDKWIAKTEQMAKKKETELKSF